MITLDRELCFTLMYILCLIISCTYKYFLDAVFQKVLNREASSPLNPEKAIIRSEISSITIIMKVFCAFNIPVFLLLLLSYFSEISFFEYCFSVSLSSLLILLALHKYGEKRWWEGKNILTYLFDK